MKDRVRELNLLKLQRIKNVMTFREAIYLLVILMMTVNSFMHEEKVIFEDPVSKSRIWFKGDSVSRQYLEDMSLHFAHLMLDKNVKNSKYNHQKILSYVHPDSFASLKLKLLADEKRYKRENLSTSFYPIKAEINMKDNTVVLPGELLTRVANREVTREKKIFKVKFKNKHVTWYLSEFRVKKEKKDG